MSTSDRQPAVDRRVHPWAWWCWALCLALAVSWTTNPLLISLVALAITAVVLLRRSDAPWARSVGAYFALAGIVVAIRVGFQILIGADAGQTVLFTLPEVPLPDWAAGIRLGGPVSAEALAFTVYEGLRLGIMLVCLGAANALANPRQALRSVPSALYEASVAVVIALSVAPQLISSARRVTRARRLRGGRTRGFKAMTAVVVPVLEDAVERSIALAAGMESRGFGRSGGLPGRGTLVVMLGSVMVATFGAFLLLGNSAMPLALSCLGAGIAGTVWGLRRAGRRREVTRYAPQSWRGRDTAIAACGGLAAAFTFALSAAAPAALNPSTDPLVWPALDPAMLLVALAAAFPIALTIPSRTPTASPEAEAPPRVTSPRPRAAEAVAA